MFVWYYFIYAFVCPRVAYNNNNNNIIRTTECPFTYYYCTAHAQQTWSYYDYHVLVYFTFVLMSFLFPSHRRFRRKSHGYHRIRKPCAFIKQYDIIIIIIKMTFYIYLKQLEAFDSFHYVLRSRKKMCKPIRTGCFDKKKKKKTTEKTRETKR